MLCLAVETPLYQTMKDYVAATIALVSTIVCVVFCWDGHWATGISIWVAGLTLASQIFLGFVETFEGPLVKVAYGCSLALSVFAIFLEHRLFEPGRAEVQAMGLSAFVSLVPNQCAGHPKDFSAWTEKGIRACAMQNTTDVMDVAQAFHKAEKLPSELTLADGIYQLSQPETPDRCVEMLKELANICPDSLSLEARRKLDSLHRK